MSDLEELRKQLRSDFEEIESAFNGAYKDEIVRLSGLSKETLQGITMRADLETYEKLKKVVQQASANNLSQAELKRNIEDLGAVAMKIAKAADILV
ncbi:MULTISPECIES: hypothetical protein [Vibrio harveyi group]|uniref:hypothetical protein n=1 Tax=Vibrio harveyi group TaxID=717610 RepID=UPI001EEC8658|nr:MULTISPECIES: hypothetical protein [Vibrio harveyi group]MCG6437294.1 hypothetical protein [Vibrio parahaemolyticus]MCS0195466.1 hypothetical protein [Vibrio alginolyticus]HCH4001838.1 hypothetical protein [Vibrio parahaemolyticus]